ncbi:MAG: amidohydrolase family protein [Planctomycetaceae bacterium]|nr:amidohydrolase family protein [Planctomycetaceae bacterium]
MIDPFEIRDIDRRIWEQELDQFVPEKVFDAHSHIYKWDFNLDPEKNTGSMAKLVLPHFTEVPFERLDRADVLLMPGREVHRLSFPFPFSHPCDFDASNDYIANEMRQDEQSGALMLVHPGMSSEEIYEQLDRSGFLGFKPYRVYSSSGDAVNCSITDFMPEHQIEIAHEKGLIIMMHLSKKDAVADPDNLRDLQDLSQRYPNARWVLAHCARSYSTWAIERAASVLRELPNVWYDTSSVCETDAIAALIQTVGPNRVMYGSDDIPVGVLRGKYITFGFGWAYLSPENHQLNLTHCESEMTFTRYEQLRAMKRAADLLGMGVPEIQDLFHNTAIDLVNGVKSCT